MTSALGERGRNPKLDALWARASTDGALPPDDERALAEAAADDARLREDLLDDERVAGALRALGRGTRDAEAFSRRFFERVAAERDSTGFVSRVEGRLAVEAIARERRRHEPHGRWLPRLLVWLTLPALGAAAALLVVDARREPGPENAPDGRGPTVSGEAQRVGIAPMRVFGADARIEWITGTVHLLADARQMPALTGMRIGAEQGLTTIDRDASATVVFADRTRMVLGGDSVIGQVSEAAGKSVFLASGILTADVTPQPADRPMVISTPHGEVTVLGTRFSLRVSDRATRLDVEHGRVRFVRHRDGARIDVGAGQYALSGLAQDFAAITRPQHGTAVLVVGSLRLPPTDALVKARLERLGFGVRVQGGGPLVEDLRSSSVVLISSTVSSLDVNTHYRELPVPIVSWESWLFDDLGMTGQSEDEDFGSFKSNGEVVIHDPTHRLAAGLAGTVGVLSGPGTMSFGIPGPGALWIATVPGLPTRAVAFAYEAGKPMPGLPAAPARRAALHLWDDSGPSMTEAGWALFDALVLWATEKS